MTKAKHTAKRKTVAKFDNTLWAWVRYTKGKPEYVCKGWSIADSKADLLAKPCHPQHPSRHVRPMQLAVRIVPIPPRKPRAARTRGGRKGK